MIVGHFCRERCSLCHPFTLKLFSFLPTMPSFLVHETPGPLLPARAWLHLTAWHAAPAIGSHARICTPVALLHTRHPSRLHACTHISALHADAQLLLLLLTRAPSQQLHTARTRRTTAHADDMRHDGDAEDKPSSTISVPCIGLLTPLLSAQAASALPLTAIWRIWPAQAVHLSHTTGHAPHLTASDCAWPHMSHLAPHSTTHVIHMPNIGVTITHTLAPLSDIAVVNVMYLYVPSRTLPDLACRCPPGSPPHASVHDTIKIKHRPAPASLRMRGGGDEPPNRSNINNNPFLRAEIERGRDTSIEYADDRVICLSSTPTFFLGLETRKRKATVVAQPRKKRPENGARCDLSSVPLTSSIPTCLGLTSVQMGYGSSNRARKAPAHGSVRDYPRHYCVQYQKGFRFHYHVYWNTYPGMEMMTFSSDEEASEEELEVDADEVDVAEDEELGDGEGALGVDEGDELELTEVSNMFGPDE